ncbi:hypothetical protein [Saccharopolyspora spinosa]|nr:hypothetical protein [Saccharopolyspora spinosa]
MFLVLTWTLSDGAFESWGWRIPLLSGLALAAIGIYVQLQYVDDGRGTNSPPCSPPTASSSRCPRRAGGTS